MLELREIYKYYNPGTVNEMCLFNNFNFKVDDGEFVAVVGSNGSGKTSMLNIICGSIPVDMGQAKHWYEQARQKGQAEAAKALDALRVHVQTEADKGNAEARSLLQNWK